MSKLSLEELFKIYSETKDELVRNQIVEQTLYIADIMAKKMCGRGVDYDDLYQVACVALIGAVERFDYSKGLKFSTFATPCILGEIKNYFRDKSRFIKVGRVRNQQSIDIKRFIEQYQRDNERMPTNQEIADSLKLDIATVIEVLEFNKGVISLDSKIDDGETELYEIIPDSTDKFEEVNITYDLLKAMKDLSPKEKQIVKLRFIDELSQNQVAQLMQVSQMYISRAERKIIQKIRKEYLS